MKSTINALYILVLGEICLGGGGRLIAVGPVSLRMVLFTLTIGFTTVMILRGKTLPKEYQLLLTIFFFTIVVGLIRGISQDAQRIFWWQDVKPLLYFFMLPFFYFVNESKQCIQNTGSVIKFSAVFLSIAFFVVLLLIHTGLLPFLKFYNPAIQSEEFFFRGELTFFYKGFLYLCIGFIFFHLAGKRNTLAMVVVLVAIIFTFTRGFLFALALTYMVHYFLKSSKVKSAAFAGIALLIIFFGQPVIGYISQQIDSLRNTIQAEMSGTPSGRHVPDATLLGDREFSDTGRLQQIKEVIDQITPTSFFIGHGFGIGIPSRPVHMEISYLEIVHKQGLLGLLFWLYILCLLFRKYTAAERTGLRDAFFCGAIFVFFQSLTNQYMNNPIGLTMILISLVCLDHLKRKGTVFNNTTNTTLSNQKSAELYDQNF
jgi:hypothetical protein